MRALLQKPIFVSDADVPTALVLGEGLAGLLAVKALTDLGIASTWVKTGTGGRSLFCPSAEFEAGRYMQALSERLEGVQIRTEKHFPVIHRDRHEFVARFSDGSESRVGCLFSTPEVSMSVLPDDLPEGTEIVSAAGLSRKGMTVVFLLDYGSPSPLAVGMEAIRQAAENVDSGGKSIVVFRNAPVAYLFGEELYESAKRSGVQFYRFGRELPLAVREGPTGKYRVTVTDMIEAGDSVVLDCDRLLAATGLDVSSLTDHAAEIFGVETDSNGFLISESIHCHSGRSFKNGIFSIGTATGNLDFIGTVVEAASAAARARAWMVQAAQSHDQLTLDVTEQCCRCLTCQRMCPHDAIALSQSTARFHAHASAPVCQGCGLCVAECPRLALDLVDFPDERFADFLAQVRDKGDSRSVAVYGCERSAGRIVNRVRLPEHAHFLSVPCAGRISESVLWGTLQAGAAGVLVMGCHHGNCASDTGTDGAAARVSIVIEKLDVTGAITPLLRYVTVAPNEKVRFVRILEEFCSLYREF